MKNIRNHKISSIVAIVLGGFYIVLGLFILIMNNKLGALDNGFSGIYLGVGYLGFGLMLKYSKQTMTTMLSLLALIALTVTIILHGVFQAGGATLNLLSLIYLVILVLDYNYYKNSALKP